MDEMRLDGLKPVLSFSSNFRLELLQVNYILYRVSAPKDVVDYTDI